MKRILTTIIAISAFVFSAEAHAVKDVTVESCTMERSGNYVVVDMVLDITNLDVKSSQAVVLTPQITRSAKSLELPSVGIYGRNRHFYFARNEKRAPQSSEDISYRANKAPNKVTYHEVIPFEEWMEGSSLMFVREDYACTGAVYNQQASVISEPIEAVDAAAFIPQLIYLRPAVSNEKLYAISGSAFVDFPVSKMEINPNYRNNSAEIAKITSTIDVVRNDKDATIKSISIKGFASPESPYSNNERLAKGRAEALKRYVESQYQFEDGVITTSYEPEDWAGLEKFVAESNISNKKAILEAIRSEREPDNKEWWIKKNWKAEYDYLLANSYPALRHSDYVVEYTIRKFISVKEIESVLQTEPQKLSLDELYLLAQSYEEGSDELNELFETAVRLYPNDPVANINAANSAILNGDYDRALRYLDKAGNCPEAIYTRGVVEIYKENYKGALPYLNKANEQGVAQAVQAIEAINNLK